MTKHSAAATTAHCPAIGGTNVKILLIIIATSVIVVGGAGGNSHVLSGVLVINGSIKIV